MRRWICGMLSLFLILSILSGCSNETTEVAVTEINSSPPEQKIPSYSLSLAFCGSAMIERYQKMADSVSLRTDGDLNIEIFPDDVLGADPELLKAMKQGSISMVAASSSIYSRAIVPQLAVLDIPACYTEYITPYVSYHGAFYQSMNRYFNEKGLELLSLEADDYRIMTSSVPHDTLESLKGMRIRTLNNPNHIKLWEALGAIPTGEISFRDLYHALEEGSIDAQENGINVTLSKNLQNVTPYFLNGPFYLAGNTLAINKETFDSLPTKYQNVLKEEAFRCSKAAVNAFKVNTKLPEGTELLRLSTSYHQKMRVLAQPILNDIRSTAGEELLLQLSIENRLRASEE